MKKLMLILAAMALLVPAFAKTDLSKYVIVYPAAAEAEEGAEIAAAVAAEVALQTGVQVPVVTDETPAVKKEILVGRTNRPESEAFYAANPDTFDYFLGIKGGRTAQTITLSHNGMDDENTLDNPEKITPKQGTLTCDEGKKNTLLLDDIPAKTFRLYKIKK